ncbi:3'-5' exonuclease [Methanospirillum lacunae]|uniref:3'-5' exonuclease n=1 Tax=Methanospirillum lacunae TaxID=668570 RepID=A0A2V2N5Q1_9EURY|nr:3'-5' exonuclease [Methanospirillum lacunae]PWR71547.1 3'-5' exonuclease [Methanospirillum lacunae]
MKPDLLLFFDTETTGTDPRLARAVEIAWIVCTSDGQIVKEETHLVKPKGFTIPDQAAAIHGITTEIAETEGLDLSVILKELLADVSRTGLLVGHNVAYDLDIIAHECSREKIDSLKFREKPSFCTMKSLTSFCKIPFPSGTEFKYPKLGEAYEKLLGESLLDAHDALIDTDACKMIFFKAIEMDIFRFNESPRPDVEVRIC